MTLSVATVLILLFVALVLFGTERLPIDVVTILVVIGLVITRVLKSGGSLRRVRKRHHHH